MRSNLRTSFTVIPTPRVLYHPPSLRLPNLSSSPGTGYRTACCISSWMNTMGNSTTSQADLLTCNSQRNARAQEHNAQDHQLEWQSEQFSARACLSVESPRALLSVNENPDYYRIMFLDFSGPECVGVPWPFLDKGKGLPRSRRPSPSITFPSKAPRLHEFFYLETAGYYCNLKFWKYQPLGGPA